MPRKTRFQIGPLQVDEGCEHVEGLPNLLGLLLMDSLSDRGLLDQGGEGEAIDLIVTPDLRQLRLASAELPFTRLELAIQVARPEVDEPLYLRRVEVETRRRAGEVDSPDRLRDAPRRTSLGRAAATCVDSLVDALQAKFGVLTDSGQGVVR